MFDSPKTTPAANGERTITGTRRSPARKAAFVEHGFGRAAARGYPAVREPR